MPPSARLTTMFYSNVSEGPAAVPARLFEVPRACMRVGSPKQAYALAEATKTDSLPSSDLRRAKQRVPRSSFRGASLGTAMKKLNKVLLAEEQLKTRLCADYSLEDLHATQRVLFATRHHNLQSAYTNSDGRLLPYDSVSSLLREQERQLDEAKARPDLLHLIRDGLCHETVMMYAHHLSQETRDKLKAVESLVLPLLPEHELHPAPDAGDHAANKTYGGYFNNVGCLVCHVDPPANHPENSITV